MLRFKDYYSDLMTMIIFVTLPIEMDLFLQNVKLQLIHQNVFEYTYATLPELLGVYGRRKVQTPRVVSHRVFPIHEALGSLSDSCSRLY